jgi:hypothetical protein
VLDGEKSTNPPPTIASDTRQLCVSLISMIIGPIFSSLTSGLQLDKPEFKMQFENPPPDWLIDRLWNLNVPDDLNMYVDTHTMQEN